MIIGAPPNQSTHRRFGSVRTRCVHSKGNQSHSAEYELATANPASCLRGSRLSLEFLDRAGAQPDCLGDFQDTDPLL
jgi:hypothetical protein